MYIFVDESGTFSNPNKQQTKVSAVGAVIIPDRTMPYFTKRYEALRRRLPTDEKGEVKGKLLSEVQIAQVVGVLKQTGCLFELVAIDLGMHTEAGLAEHKLRQEEAITNDLTSGHHPNLVKGVWELRRTLESTSMPLYIQSIAMVELAYTILNHAQTYFAFRYPKELAEFHWTVDAKERVGVTSWEKWWRTIVLPMLESYTMREPIMAVEGGDYSALKKFEMDISPYKRQFMKQSATAQSFNLNPVMTEDFRFSADPDFGLEAADIMVTAVRRSLSGTLSRSGWTEIPSIMINRKQQCFRMIALTPHDTELRASGLPYRHVIKDFNVGGRTLLPS